MTETRQIKGRSLQAIVVVIGYLITTPIAHASMACWRFDQLDRISDPSAKKLLEAYAKALPGLDNPEVRELHGHYFLVQGDGKFCKSNPRCEHRLLYLRDGVVRDIFAFRGTGAIWQSLSPGGGWLEYLQDDYSSWAFEVTEDTFISLSLPRYHDMIFIDPPGFEGLKVLKVACQRFHENKEMRKKND